MFTSRKTKPLYTNFTQLKDCVNDVQLLLNKKSVGSVLGYPEVRNIECSLSTWQSFIISGEDTINEFNEGILSYQDLEFLDDKAQVFLLQAQSVHEFMLHSIH